LHSELIAHTIQILETFITQSSRPKSSGTKLWVLVRSPFEPIIGPALPGLERERTTIEPFETGFLDAPLETLVKYVRENRPSESEQRELNMNIDETIFAVLDSRSTRDGTVAIYHYYQRMPEETFEEDENAWDPEIAVPQWIEWRVKFLTAGTWAAGLWFMPEYADFEIGRSEYVDEDGVLQLPNIEHDENELPGLKEEEKAAWGPERSLEERSKSWRYAASPFHDLCDSGIVKVHKAAPRKYPK
jgi:hypothetical protein